MLEEMAVVVLKTGIELRFHLKSCVPKVAGLEHQLDRS